MALDPSQVSSSREDLHATDSTQPIPLSPSVTAVQNELRRKKHVSSWGFVQELLRHHPEYGDKLGGKLAHETGPSGAAEKTAQHWLEEVHSILHRERAKELHGRLLILALARVDPPLREFLTSVGLLDAIEKEMREPVDDLLLRRPHIDADSGPPDIAPVHPDQPSADDQLGRESFARALALRLGRIWDEYASSDARNSFIVHLHGPWGAGKTSLLKMLRKAMQKRWIVVDFNAWRHQRLEAPWWQLLDTVHRQAVEQLWQSERRKRSLKLQISETLWRLLTIRRDLVFAVGSVVFLAGVLYWILRPTALLGALTDASVDAKRVSDILALLGTLISVGILVGRSLVSGGVRSAQDFVTSNADPMARITSHFRAQVGRISAPLAIFIDDLDRCQEDYVVNLLEGIQTLFSDSRVIYVVAADRSWLHACYENAYSRFSKEVWEPGRKLGMLFLEKIFQLSVSVPRVSTEHKESYWRFLLRGSERELKSKLDEEREAARGEFAQAGSEAEVFLKLQPDQADPVRSQARREAAVERLATQEVEESTLYFLERFASLLEPNPRGMKRLLNAYAVHRDLAILYGLDVLVDLRRREQLALWTILSLRWPLLRDYLVDRVEGREKTPEDAIQDLVGSEDVRRVLDGVGVTASLDTDSIQLLLGLGEPGGRSGGAVA